MFSMLVMLFFFFVDKKKHLIWFQLQIRKLLLLPNPTKNERNKVLRKIAIKSNIKDWHPGYKWSRPEFKSSDWNFANKEWFPEFKNSYWEDWHSGYNWHGNFADKDLSSSTSTSPESMSHVSITKLNVGPSLRISLPNLIASLF